MRIVIEIDTSNDAFDDTNEIYNVLSRARMWFHNVGCAVKAGERTLFDSNGNTVGTMTVEK